MANSLGTSQAAPYDDDIFGINILALDGGGIYGLTEALLLRKLCERCPWFLGGKDVQIFAGCSAGAINALILAQYERPREAVLAGRLEAFWQDAGTFSNTDPVEAYLSFFGITPWFSDRDFLVLLSKHFGDATLDNLEQHVVITTFNWVGGKPDFGEVSPPVPWPLGMFRPGALAQSRGGGESWGPLCFHNLTPPDGWDPATDPRGDDYLGSHYRLVDVAYAAAAPPGLRRIRGGVGDGGSYNANPAMTALGVTKYYIDFVRRHSDFEAFLRKEAQEGDLDTPGQVQDVLGEYREEYRDPSLRSSWSLDKITVFSIGSGQAMPSSFLRDVDLGSAMIAVMPTNPSQGIFYPPSAYAVDPASKDAELICQRLLRDHFHRLNPPLMPIPTLVAVYLSRFPWMRDSLIRQIYEAVDTPTSLEALGEALEFLGSRWRLPRPIDEYKQELVRQAKRAVYERYLLTADRIVLATAETCWSAIAPALRAKLLSARREISEALLAENPGPRPTPEEWKAAREALRAVIDAIPLANREAVRRELVRSPQLVQEMANRFQITPAALLALEPGILELLKAYYAPRTMEMTLRLLQAARHLEISVLVQIYDNITRETIILPARTGRARRLFEARDPRALSGIGEHNLSDLVLCVFEGTRDVLDVIHRDSKLESALGEALVDVLARACVNEPRPGSNIHAYGPPSGA